MDDAKIANQLVDVIRKAGGQDGDELKLVRRSLIKIVDTIGANRFVTVAASVLKNNFKIEGCNDVRIPLKRIFSVSLEELDESLSNKRYNLPKDHPLSILSDDHKANIKKLKILHASLEAIKGGVADTDIKDALEMVNAYCAELDSHIRKEEEVLFPVLEANGMQEHPQNLMEEHKKFREVLSEIIKSLEDPAVKGADSTIDKVGKLKKGFISDMSNHVFRETFIFYPANLEFITKKEKWQKIKEEFQKIR